MKKLVFITTAFILIAGYGVNAQNGTQPHPHINKQVQDKTMVMQQNKKMEAMLNNGVCDHMMDQNKTMNKYYMILNKLPEMQQKLSLNDKQVKELEDLQSLFKEKMQNFADTKDNMSTTTYETVEKMKAVLTPEQKEQLKTKMVLQENRINSEKRNRLSKSSGMMNYCDNK